ncbi:translation elongation factor Ts [Ureaplasma ceti]|uniref:Elongation factor Ts n=1 Tax=Ureaplasma ceti TaxID=3119530 RepID=A0ABP9UB67_9BACT
MASKTELVKQLRAMTGAGMSDCMKALKESNDDVESAVEWLRKNGVAKAAKKANAIAAEGLALAKLSQCGCKAVVVEVNCQTDFVAKNENFVKYTNEIIDGALKEANSSEEIANLKINGVSLEDAAQDLTAKIGEKIAFRRGAILKANDNQTIGIYTHMNNRVATAVLLEGKVDREVATNIAMHIAAMNPKYVNETEVDQEWLNKEREIIVEQTKAESNKPAEFLNKIVDGRVNKLLKEVCLVSQPYVKEPSMTVAEYLKSNGASAIKMINIVLGEGIEKKVSNFADEVAEQMGQK